MAETEGGDMSRHAFQIAYVIYAGDGGITVSAARADRSPRPHD
jgi:hypothetical protein